jgi:hypothetical protein
VRNRIQATAEAIEWPENENEQGELRGLTLGRRRHGRPSSERQPAAPPRDGPGLAGTEVAPHGSESEAAPLLPVR